MPDFEIDSKARKEEGTRDGGQSFINTEQLS
jgi:hypothetical protein